MAKMKEIKVALGISVEIGGTWYRPNAEVTIELDEADSPDKRKQIWNKAWEVVTEQVEKQINEAAAR